MYPGKMFIDWLMMLLQHMTTIHMKKNEDGKNVDQELSEGSLQAYTKY
jgi:hypothetical protein